MKLAELQEAILNSDEFVLAETKKIQCGYGLKHVIRYIVEREEAVASESVAEHVYALHLIADYFLPLEDPGRSLDWRKVHDMLQYHDIDEIETGDVIGYLKTAEQRDEEADAQERVLTQFPDHIATTIRPILAEYEAQETTEAKFAKALDRMEPLFQLYTENGKRVLHLQKTTRENSRVLKIEIVNPFPYLQRFYQVIEDTMEKEGYFVTT